MLLLLDIGNTNTHVGLANSRGVVRHFDLPTAGWLQPGVKSSPPRSRKRLLELIGKTQVEGAILCSVVPRATPILKQFLKQLWNLTCLELTPKTLRGVGIDYPKPHTIGPDRLANAVAARQHHGAPVVVVDFGTAVTFDVVNEDGNYAGGIIAPGLAAMTDYLHDKTALLPRIRIREPRRTIGKSTEEAMLAGAVHGYRGLIRGLVSELKQELKAPHLPIVATGGYANLIASRLPEITAVDSKLTLEGLRLVYEATSHGV